MLPDKERKLLRILSSYVFKNKQFPSMWLLWRKTGLREGVLLRSLNSLAAGGYIEWDAKRHSEARILSEWEEGSNIRPRLDLRSIEPWEMESF